MGVATGLMMTVKRRARSVGTRPSPDGSPINVLRYVSLRFDPAPIRTLTSVLPPVHFADVRCNCHCPRHGVLQGSDHIRQAFSKRKKGLVLKALQLNSLTDAKVSAVDWSEPFTG